MCSASRSFVTGILFDYIMLWIFFCAQALSSVQRGCCVTGSEKVGENSSLFLIQPSKAHLPPTTHPSSFFYFYFFTLLLATSRECSSLGQGEVTTMECRAWPLQKALLTLKGQKMKSNPPVPVLRELAPCVSRTVLHLSASDREMWSKQQINLLH